MRNQSLNFLKQRINILLIIFSILLLLLIGRFFQLQIIKGPEYKGLREQNINASESIYPKRGRILSKDGFVLAEDEKVFSIHVDLEQKPNEESVALLSSIYQDALSVDKVQNSVALSIRTNKPETILDSLTQEELSKFLVRSSELRGFSVQESYTRKYNAHPSIFHVLGHLGFVNDADAEYFSE